MGQLAHPPHVASPHIAFVPSPPPAFLDSKYSSFPSVFPFFLLSHVVYLPFYSFSLSFPVSCFRIFSNVLSPSFLFLFSCPSFSSLLCFPYIYLFTSTLLPTVPSSSVSPLFPSPTSWLSSSSPSFVIISTIPLLVYLASIYFSSLPSPLPLPYYFLCLVSFPNSLPPFFLSFFSFLSFFFSCSSCLHLFTYTLSLLPYFFLCLALLPQRLASLLPLLLSFFLSILSIFPLS